jgi:DNA modification methylase
VSDTLTPGDLPQPAFEGILSVEELDTDGENPNEMTDEQFGLLCDRLRENGWLSGPVITDTDGLIADGEHRYRAAQEIGLEEVPVRQYDIDDAERRLWRQELNKISGEHDAKRDALEYDELLAAGKSDEVERLTDAAGEDLNELLAEIRVDTTCSPAYEYDVDHDIYYEDCVEGMQSRLDDDSVDCVIADPPYGFDYQGRGDQEFDSLANYDDWDLFENFLDEVRRVVTDTGHVYVWWGWQHYGRMEDLFRERFEHLSTLIWVKNNFGITGPEVRDRYRPQYEVCFYGSVGDNRRDLNDADRLADVLEYQRADTSAYSHPTEKPVPLIEELVHNSTDPEDTVLDPFVGSGTTAVAALQADRNFVGFEIDEKNYREVIDRRVQEVQRIKAAAEGDTGGNAGDDE